MAIAQDLVDGALRKLGVSIPKLTDRNNGLLALNSLLSSWGAKRLLVYEVARETFSLTIGKASYSLSTGRRIKIVSAYLRDAGLDYPLQIGVLKDYNEIVDKAVNGLPTELYYVQNPIGMIIFDYKPDKAYTLFFDSWKTLSTFSALNTVVTLPPEYERALIFNLAVELAPEYDEALSKEAIASAVDSREILEGANSQSLQESKFDSAIIGAGRYNIYTDN